MEEIFAKELGNRIKLRLMDLDMTQRNLAEELFLSPQVINKIVLGKKVPYADLLVAIAEKLDMTTDELVGLNSHRNQNDALDQIIELCNRLRK